MYKRKNTYTIVYKRSINDWAHFWIQNQKRGVACPQPLWERKKSKRYTNEKIRIQSCKNEVQTIELIFESKIRKGGVGDMHLVNTEFFVRHVRRPFKTLYFGTFLQDSLPILGAPWPKITNRSFWPSCDQMVLLTGVRPKSGFYTFDRRATISLSRYFWPMVRLASQEPLFNVSNLFSKFCPFF